MTFPKEINEYGVCNYIAIMNSFIITIGHGEFNINLYLTGNCKDSVGHCPTMSIMNLSVFMTTTIKLNILLFLNALTPLIITVTYK